MSKSAKRKFISSMLDFIPIAIVIGVAMVAMAAITAAASNLGDAIFKP